MGTKTILVFLLAVIVGYNLYDGFDPGIVKGKRVLVTGASTGIGEQMAYHYAKLGAHVLITARREQRLKEVIEECKRIGAPGGSYHYVTADMGEFEDREKVIDTAKSTLGGLDYLVLNHIIIADLGEWRGSRQNLTHLDKTMEINFKAYVHLASGTMDMLEKSRGSIVVVSSIAGRLGQPYVAPYSASKFALDGFFAGLRQEFIIKDVDVSITVCIIGRVKTDNAVVQLRTFGADLIVDLFPMASAEDAGWAIIRGGALRVREIYFPFLEAAPTVYMRDIIPRVLEAMCRFMFSK